MRGQRVRQGTYRASSVVKKGGSSEKDWGTRGGQGVGARGRDGRHNTAVIPVGWRVRRRQAAERVGLW